MTSYSTTRRLTTKRPSHFSYPGASADISLLKTPDSSEKISEGGIRLNGQYKQVSKDKPIISVVTVVFNGVEFLEEAIRSVIEQPYDNVEYIIVDGGSTDGSLDIIKKYEGAIDYWVSEPDKGIYDAMNKGIRLASPDSWIFFLGADDKILNIVPVADAIIAAPDIGCIVTNVIQNDRDQNRKTVYRCWIPEADKLENDFVKFPLHHQGFLYKKGVCPFYFDRFLGVHADLDLMIRALQTYRSKYLNVEVSEFRTGGESDFFGFKNIRSLLAIASKHNVKLHRVILSNPFRSVTLFGKIFLGASIIKKIRRLGLVHSR